VEMICIDVPCIQWAIVRAKSAHTETITGSCPYFDRRPPRCKTTLSDMVAIVGDLIQSPSLLVWFSRQYGRAACDTFPASGATPARTYIRTDVLQNYPNPFNATTRISYSIAAPAFVEIRIYNVAGQEMRTLVLERKDAGCHETIWNGRDNAGRELASGVYFLMLRTGNEMLSKKMILLR